MKKNKKTHKKSADKNKSKLWWAVGAAILIAAAALTVIFVSCGKEDKKMSYDNVKVKVEMENGGEFTLELYPEYAPQTVENFVELVTDGFYDGVGFHRIVDGFMAQGGDAVRQALGMTHGGGADHQQGVREGTLAGQVDLGHVDSLVFLKPRLDDGHFFRRRQFRIFLGGRDKVLHVPPIPQSVPEGNNPARPGDSPAHCSGHKKRQVHN